VLDSHYAALTIAYAAALAGWVLIDRRAPSLWPRGAPETFANAWVEFAIALAGAVGVIAVGQLWAHGIHLPEHGPLGPLLGAVDQVLIFAPMLLVVRIRRQPWTSAWLSRPRIVQRLGNGLALSVVAVTVYASVRAGAPAPWTLVGRVWRYGNLDIAAQVLLEDIAIAILFVRLAAAIGARWATVLVAVLFAVGHIPAMVAGGATWSELGGLLRDAALGAAAISVLQHSRDVLWFWCIHFSLDMMQFGRITGLAGG
jgi:hypothetical protein